MITSWIIIVLGLVGGLQAAKSKTVDTFWLKASAQVLMSPHQLRLTCRVPRNEDNRSMTIGIAGYTSSDIPLDGNRAPQTHERWFSHLPCGPQVTYCRVTGPAGVNWQTTLPMVSVCEGAGTPDAF